jgi:hypothetical protein
VLLRRRTQAEAGPRPSVHAPRPRGVLSGHLPLPSSPVGRAAEYPPVLLRSSPVHARLPRYDRSTAAITSRIFHDEGLEPHLPLLAITGRSPCRLAHIVAPTDPASAAPPWSRLLWPSPPQTDAPSLFPLRHSSVPSREWPTKPFDGRGRAPASPEASSRRPPPPDAAVLARRRYSCLSSGPKSHPCDHVDLPRCFSGQDQRRARRNSTGPPSAAPQGPHCKVSNPSEGLSAN